jgi:hypothetical protein
MVVSVQPAVVVAGLELVVAEVAAVAVVLAHAAVARLLGVAGGLVAEGLVAKERKMGVNYNMMPLLRFSFPHETWAIINAVEG